MNYMEGVLKGRWSARQSQHAQSLKDMLEKYRNIVGGDEVGGGRDEDSAAVEGRTEATDVFASTK